MSQKYKQGGPIKLTTRYSINELALLGVNVNNLGLPRRRRRRNAVVNNTNQQLVNTNQQLVNPNQQILVSNQSNPNTVTFNGTFKGVSNLSNLNGEPFVQFKYIDNNNHVLMQWEPFNFTMKNSLGYIELENNVQHVPNKEVNNVIEAIINDFTTLATSVVSNQGCGNVLRFYFNQGNRKVKNGDNIQIKGHSMFWIK